MKHKNDEIEKETFEMPKITIDEQFKALLPALDSQTYAQLEASLLENGCMHPLVLWNGILIDGHNRYEICTKHEIPFKTVEKEFESREEALIWIITTQVGRRNLTQIQLSYYRGLHYNTDKQGASNQHTKKSAGGQSDHQQNNQKTEARLAEEYNVSPKTIRRDSQLAKAIDAIGESSPEAKREILSGTAGISRQRLQELAQGGTEDEIKSIAETIEQGTYERPRRATADESLKGILDALNAIMAQMAKAYSADIRQAENSGEAEQFRSALRDHIDKLEDFYRSL